MELDLYRFPDDAFHSSGFLWQDTGVMKLFVVTQVNHKFDLHHHENLKSHTF
jgi:hypothetical protein